MSKPESEDLRPLLQRSLTQVRQAADELEALRRGPLAIVGQACRLPGAPDPTRFLELLQSARSALVQRPSDRDVAFAGEFAEVDAIGGYLDDVYAFDPLAFGLSPREAQHTDPQQRLCLELAREALLDAGLEPESLFDTRLGIWVGISTIDWGAHLARVLNRDAIAAASGLGSAHSAAAGRIAYWLGTRGPAVAIDTACSSGLIALEAAADALRSGRVDRALVLGVNLILQPHTGQSFRKAGMTSPTGACRSFDHRADGYVRGEGGAAVLLEREASDRPALAILRAVATGQDGRSAGLSAPRGPAQVQVIRAALEQARWSPDDLHFIEGHGTGTDLGDRIELGALNDVFGQRQDPLPLRSVKGQLGHLEAAAGLAGLLKAIAQLRSGAVFGQCQHEQLPAEWKSSQIQVSPDQQPLAPGQQPWRGGVSSFGFTGTNAHALLEAAPTPRPLSADPKPPEYSRRPCAVEFDGAQPTSSDARIHSVGIVWREVEAGVSIDPLPSRRAFEFPASNQSDPRAGLERLSQWATQLQRALASARREAEWCVITRGAHRIADEQRQVDAFGAAVWGLLRCVRLEHPERSIRLIDLEPGEPLQVDTILLPPDSELARRDGRWFTPRLEPLSPVASSATRPGSWWLVGGSGDIGRSLQAELDRHPDCTARSLSRSPQSDLQLDLADEGSVAKVTSEQAAPDVWVHLAGRVDNVAFARMGPDHLEAAFTAKSLGADRLAQAFQEQGSLPHCVAVTSTTAWFGNPGQAAYAAANGYLAARADNWRSAGHSATAVVLGPVRGTAAAEDSAVSAHLDRAGLEGLEHGRVSEVLLSAPHSLRAERGLIAGDLQQLAEQLSDHPLLVDYRSTPQPLALVDEQGQPLAPEARRSAFHEVFAESAQTALGLGPSEWPNTGVLLELGLDSLTAVELAHLLHRRTGLVFEPVAFLEDRPWPDVADRLLELESQSAQALDSLEQRVMDLDDAEIQRLLAEQQDLDA